MYIEFHINSDELNENFLNSIKSLFKGKKISVYIEPDMDETAYLTSSESNKEKLDKSIKEIEQGKTVKVSLDEIFEKE